MHLGKKCSKANVKRFNFNFSKCCKHFILILIVDLFLHLSENLSNEAWPMTVIKSVKLFYKTKSWTHFSSCLQTSFSEARRLQNERILQIEFSSKIC